MTGEVLVLRCRRAGTWVLALSMAVAGLGVVEVASAPAATAAGYYFTGEVTTNWRNVHSWGGGAETITEAGSATFTDLQPADGTVGAYTAVADVGGSIVQRYEGSCSSTVTTNFNGLYGDDEGESPGALSIGERDDGSVWFAAHDIYAEYPWTTTCGEGGSGQTWTGAGGHNYPFELTTDTHPAADRLVGQMSWTYPNLPGGEPPLDSLTEYTYTVTYDLTMHPVDCVEPPSERFDSFLARVPEVPEPRLRFEVTSLWCPTSAGIVVMSSEANGEALDSPLEAAIAASVREFFSIHDSWRKVKALVAGDQVTATGSWDHCFGIPILGKVKWVTKTPKVMRFAADLLRDLDGRAGRLARPIAKLIDKAADLVASALKHGGRIARRLAKEAVGFVTDSITLLPGRVQTDILLVTVGVVADYQTSAPWARAYVKRLVAKDGKLILGKVSDGLEHFFSDELVCFAGWRPKIVQTLSPAGAEGSFIDRDGDYEGWRVERGVS